MAGPYSSILGKHATMDEVSLEDGSPSQREKLDLRMPQRNNTIISRQPAQKRPKFQWGTLTPFIWAFILTFGPTLGLLIYLLATKVTEVGSCGGPGRDPCPFYGNVTISQRSLIISEPLGRFLTVTKVVDTVQQLAITWVLALAAFAIAQSWIASNTLTTRTLALVINMYASGRWWALWESFRVVFSKRRGKSSRTFVQALVILLIALLLSKLATGMDLWIHYASHEEVFATGALTPLATQQPWGRQINNTCRRSLNGVTQSDTPCTIIPSALGTALSFPALAAALSTNSSQTDEIALVFDHSVANDNVNASLGYANMAIVVPKENAGVQGHAYNASTIGVSTYCRSVTTICDSFQIPHGTSRYNCTGQFQGREAVQFSQYFQSGNSNGVLAHSTGGNGSYANPEVHYIAQFLIAGNGSQFTGGSAQAASLLNLQQCTMGTYYVNYTSSQVGLEPRNLTITGRQLMDINSSKTISAATIMAVFEDALSNSKGAAQVSSEAFDYTNGYQLSRFALAYAAGAWSNVSTIDAALTPQARSYSCIPLAPLATFFGLVFTYSVFVVLLFIWSTRTGKQILRIITNGTADNDETVGENAETVTMTELAQRRLVRTDFLLYQLLSEDGQKSTKTDADDVMRGEDSQLAVAELVDGRFGVYATGKDGEVGSPIWSMDRSRSFQAKRSGSQRSMLNLPSVTRSSTLRDVPSPSSIARAY